MKTKNLPSLMAMHFIALFSTVSVYSPSAIAGNGRNIGEAELGWNPRSLGNRFNARIARHEQQGHMAVGVDLAVYSGSGRALDSQPLWISFSLDVTSPVPTALNDGMAFSIPSSQYTVKCAATQNVPRPMNVIVRQTEDPIVRGTLDIGQCTIRDKLHDNAIVDETLRDGILVQLGLLRSGSQAAHNHFMVAELNQFRDRESGTVIDTTLPPRAPVSAPSIQLAQNGRGRTRRVGSVLGSDAHNPDSAFNLNGEVAPIVEEASTGANVDE